MKRSGPHKTYKGKIDPSTLKNPQKYEGDINNIVYRSMWERNVINWLDGNPNVVKYASEEIFFYYDNPVTGKRSKYYPDFYIKMSDGTQRIIEVKPKKQTSAPVKQSRQTQKYISEVSTWMINQEKWRTADYYCKKSKMTFEIWTEDTLHEMGIRKQPKLKTLNEAKPAKHKKVAKPRRPRPTRKS